MSGQDKDNGKNLPPPKKTKKNRFRIGRQALDTMTGWVMPGDRQSRGIVIRETNATSSSSTTPAAHTTIPMLCLTPDQPSTVNEETTGVKKRKSFTGIHEKANRIGTH
jgi:hypothetical protein